MNYAEPTHETSGGENVLIYICWGVNIPALARSHLNVKRGLRWLFTGYHDTNVISTEKGAEPDPIFLHLI